MRFRWARSNLFANPTDVVLSVVTGALVVWLLVVTANWALLTARWSVVGDSLRVLLVGIYPAGQIWRIWVAADAFALMLGLSLGCVVPWTRISRKGGVTLLVAMAVMVALSLNGQVSLSVTSLILTSGWVLASRLRGRSAVLLPAWFVALVAVFTILAQPGLDEWGGLMLSIMLTIVVSVATLPLGILLAFGRRSGMPSIRICCTGYIEIMRSVPLILVVYWIWIGVPLLAPGHPISGLARGMGGYAIFYAAYVAEYVRSGLQAVPRGQVEAARSLGMPSWTVNVEIVLPQAIRVVLPALVGNVLDIFNGATLVFILGLTDFLRAGQMILADPGYSGRVYEVYAFMFAVYFAIGSTITFASRKLEARLARGGG